jgi:hypothetical protein
MVPPAGSVEQPATTTYERCVQTTGSGEKPRIRRAEAGGGWLCSSADYMGTGESPALAHLDWRLGRIVVATQIEVTSLMAGRSPYRIGEVFSKEAHDAWVTKLWEAQ